MHTKTWETDQLIQDLKTAGLPMNSYLRLKMFTLDLRLIIKELGHLAPADVKQIK